MGRAGQGASGEWEHMHVWGMGEDVEQAEVRARLGWVGAARQPCLCAPTCVSKPPSRWKSALRKAMQAPAACDSKRAVARLPQQAAAMAATMARARAAASATASRCAHACR